MSLFVLGADIEALQMQREIGIGAVPELEGAFDLVAGRGGDLDPRRIDCHRQRGWKGGRYNYEWKRYDEGERRHDARKGSATSCRVTKPKSIHTASFVICRLKPQPQFKTCPRSYT